MLMWWRTWHDTERRLWAERQMTGDPADGKRNHAADKQFRWTTPDMLAPSVSPLEFTDEHGQSRWIAAAFTRDTEQDRAYLLGGRTTPTITAEPDAPTQPTPTVRTDDDLPF